jgi:ABC-2 type transport system ATP-binding protein
MESTSLTQERAPRSTPRTTPAAIAASGLTKRFGRVRAVDGADLCVEPGEVVAFLGPNGAGKSTTIDVILGLTRPDSGEISVFGTRRLAVAG